jgi:uncharacterized protein
MAKPKRRDLPDLSDLALPGGEIAVRVIPKAARTGLTRDGDTLRVTVTAPPENGKANAATRTLIATAMGVAPSRLTLKRGATSRTKLFVYSPD